MPCHRLRTLLPLIVAAAACGAEIPAPVDPAGSSSDPAPHAPPAGTNTQTPPPPAGLPPAEAAPISGTWYLNRDGQRVALVITAHDVSRDLDVTTTPEGPGAVAARADRVSYDAAAGVLQLRAFEAGQGLWYRLHLTDGVATGRYARVTGAAVPAGPLAYTGRVTGWRDETFSAAAVPRVYDLALPGELHAVLRLDQAAPGSAALVGQLKVYALRAVEDDQPAEDVDVERWDGRTLSLVRRSNGAAPVRLSGTASGRFITGTAATLDGAAAGSWQGERAEVLTHGLTRRSAAEAAAWQSRTRAQLQALAMAGNPAPLSTTVTAGDPIDPLPLYQDLANRDDSETEWPQDYRLTELSFRSTLANPAGGAPLVRLAHGYVAVPTGAPPPGGYPIALAVNGHWGSAAQLFDPQSYSFWYGDAFARRGYVVIAVDIGHRPYEDRDAVYNDITSGDDAWNGNGPHPSIRDPALPSDWEEDGERTWDVMRALDHVLARPDVNPQRVTVAGLSMGGEVSDWVGAMDVRVAATIASGNPPDLAVMSVRPNHACWRWQRAEIREYVDPGDLHALVAPRTLVRETGHSDDCYSTAQPPFGSAKQVVRRAQPAFDALGGTFLHYLHGGAHEFHVGAGVAGRDDGDPIGLTIPAEQAPGGEDPWDTAWEDDATTQSMGTSLFDLLP
jgi:dienelactone hydrolase